MILVVVSFGLAMLLWVLGYDFNFLSVPKPGFFQYFTLAIIGIGQPLVIFTAIWKNYKSNGHLRERLEIHFTKEEIKIKGESFYTELTWHKIYKVDELRNWFLIYQNTFSAIIIPKKSFHHNQEEDFKHLLKSIPNLPLYLKE